MRGDPRPVVTLLRLQVLALLGLALWWWLQGPVTRLALLMTIWLAEHVGMRPPDDLLGQVDWLVTHRSHTGQGMLGLVGLGVLIGSVEGWRWRLEDLWQGLRLRLWTLAVLGAALLPGAVAAYLLLPWPLAGWLVPFECGLYCGLLGFALVGGRPTIR
jgi:hypothetical protein